MTATEGTAACESEQRVRRVLLAVHTGRSDIVDLARSAAARLTQAGIVVRLLDDDLARRVQETISNTISRSVSYLAAPVFAAAMLDHQVLRTIAVGWHVLMIADVPVSAGAELVEDRTLAAGQIVLVTGSDFTTISRSARDQTREIPTDEQGGTSTSTSGPSSSTGTSTGSSA